MSFDKKFKISDDSLFTAYFMNLGPGRLNVELVFNGNIKNKKSFNIPMEAFRYFYAYFFIKLSYIQKDLNTYFMNELNKIARYPYTDALPCPKWIQEEPLIIQSAEGKVISFDISLKDPSYLKITFPDPLTVAEENISFELYDYIKILQKILFATSFGEKNQFIKEFWSELIEKSEDNSQIPQC